MSSINEFSQQVLWGPLENSDYQSVHFQSVKFFEVIFVIEKV